MNMNSQKRLIGLMVMVVLVAAAVLAASAALAAPEYVTSVAINDPTTDDPIYVNMAMSPTVPIDYSIWSNEPGDVGKIEFWVGSALITTLLDVPFNGGVYNDIEVLDLSPLPLVGNQTYDAKVCANANDQSTQVCSEWYNAIVYDPDAPDWICPGGPICQLLTYPNLDTQTFEVGTIETITWRDECVEDEYMGDTPVFLAYSPNGEHGDYSTIAGGTENDGEFDWLVNVPPSNDGWLMIIISDLAGNIITDTKPIPTVWAIDYTPPVFDWGDVTLDPLYFPSVEGTSDGFISDTLTVEAYAVDAGSGIREVGFYASDTGCDGPYTAVITDYSGDLGFYSVTTDTVAGWGLYDGAYAYFRVVVENGVGARTEACNGWYYVDLSGFDQFYIDDPADGAWIKGTYDVDVYARDALHPGAGLVDYVAFEWWDADNTTWQMIGVDAHNSHSGYWDYDWNTVGLSANECFTTQLYAYGEDVMGHFADDMITVTIDNTAPGVLETTLTQPTPDQVWQYGLPITITWNMTDADDCGNDAVPVALFYGSEPGIGEGWEAVEDWYTIVDPTANDGEYEWTPTETQVVFPDRDIWIWMLVCDQAGNCAEDYAGPFTIWTMDPTLPFVDLGDPGEIGLYDSGANMLLAAAQDFESGIMNVKFYWSWPGADSWNFIDMDGVEYVAEAIDPPPWFTVLFDAMTDVGLDDDCWDPEPAQGFCDGHLIDLKAVATNGVGMTSEDVEEDVPIVSYLTPPVPTMGRPIDGSIVSGDDFLFFGWGFDAGAGEGVLTEWFYFDDTEFDIIEDFQPEWEHIGLGTKYTMIIHGETTPNSYQGEVGNGEFTMWVNTLGSPCPEQGGYGNIFDVDGDYKFIMCAVNPNDPDIYACTEGNDPYDDEYNWYGDPPVLTLDNSKESFNIWLQDGGMIAEQGLDDGWNNVSVPFYSDIDIEEALYEYIALGAVEGVHKFAGDTKEWFGWSPLGAEFDTLDDGVGYWVQVEFEEPLVENGHPPFEWMEYQITVRGTLGPEPGMAPHEYWTYPGWNNMGFTPENLYEEPLPFGIFEGTENWNNGYFFPDWDYLDGCMYLFDYLDQNPLFYDVRATYIYDPWMDMYETVEIGGLLCPGWGFWLALESGGVIYP